jgi:hypothetical protein
MTFCGHQVQTVKKLPSLVFYIDADTSIKVTHGDIDRARLNHYRIGEEFSMTFNSP